MIIVIALRIIGAVQILAGFYLTVRIAGVLANDAVIAAVISSTGTGLLYIGIAEIIALLIRLIDATNNVAVRIRQNEKQRAARKKQMLPAGEESRKSSRNDPNEDAAFDYLSD